jgi:hypothetical protein
MNEKVKLKSIAGVKEYDFAHALEIMRTDKYNDYEVVGNHEFKDNELIIKPSTRSRKKSTKSNESKGGGKVSESSKDSNGSL